MFAYILRKLLYMPFILLGVIFITFILFQMSTTPEALARIQLGEKASPRVVYDWLVTKGHASWTDEGRAKLDKLAEGELPAKDTQFFVSRRLRDTIAERDNVASRLESLGRRIERLRKRDVVEDSPSLERLRGEAAGMLRRQASNRIHIKETLLGARQIVAFQQLEVLLEEEPDEQAEEEPDESTKAEQRRQRHGKSVKAAVAMDGHNTDITFLDDEIRWRERFGLDTAEVRAARQSALAEFDKAAEGKDDLWNEYRRKTAGIKAIEDIQPDLSYTSWFVTFGYYLVDTLKLDFGENNRKRPVMEVIAEGIGPSLKLTLPAFLIAELIGVFFGLMAAMYRQTRVDHVIVISAILLMSINSIALIMGGQKVFAAEWNLFPISGYETGFSAARYLILPVFLYVMLAFGERVRFSRIVMLDETNQDYVRTARAKGLGENRVLFKHILRNTLIPLITRWIVAIPTLYLGSLVLESFFGIPGLGSLTIEAVNNSDANVIRAIVVIGSVGFMLANLLSDVLYAVADPRVRLE